MTTSDALGAQSDAQQQVIERAQAGPQSRALLPENPKEAVQEAFGIAIPANISVRVLEEQPGEVILVPPAQGVQPGTAISDEGLEAVAGGDDPPMTTGCW